MATNLAVPVGNWIQLPYPKASGAAVPMQAFVRLFFSLVVDLFRPRAVLEAELLLLRQQIIVPRLGNSSQPTFRATENCCLAGCHLFPDIRNALTILALCRLCSYWR
jgi:hypothetical protein